MTLAVTEGTLNVTAGTSGAVVSNSGTSSVTITGTVAQIDNLLSSNATSTVSYIDNTDTPSASSTLTLTVHDNGNTGTGGDLVSVATSTINITAVNDAPVATITPVSYAATEQTSLTLKGTGLSISDVDAGSGSMSVTLAVTEGTLNVTAGTSGAVVSGSGTSSVTITGTVAQINNLLSSNATSTVSYIDNTDTPSASSTLTLTVHDNGNTGTGGDLVSVATSTINITAVNDAPVATITPVSYAATEQTSLTLKGTGLSISDVDAGSGSMSVTLAVTEGTLNVTAGTSGAAVSGSGTSSVTLTGTVAQINNLLNSNATSTVSYIDNTDTPSASSTLTLTVHDNGNTGTGGDLVSVATSTINITAVNDAPVATITPVSYAATEQTSLTLKGTGLSISDVDAGSGSMSVTLAVTEGTLNVTAGTSGATVSGSGTSSVTLTGTVAQIDNLLSSNATSTVNYIDNTDTPSASSTLTLTVHDNGNTGTGGDLVSVATSTINITAVNDAPVATITPVSYAATEQTSLTLKGTGLSISDVDAGSGSMSVTLAVTEGTLNVTAGTSGATVSGSGTSSVTLTGTVAQIDNLLSSNATSTVNYIDNTDTPSASSTLTLTVHDNGNTGTGGDLVSVATSTINITAVNDAPVATITPVSYAATEQTSLTLKGTGLSISDVDAGSGSMSVTLAVTEGTLNVTAGTSGATVSGSGTSSVTLTGTVAQIDNLLSSNATSTVNYIDNTDTPSASSTLTLTVHDNGNTGTGGDLVSVATSTINITAVNDAPVATITPVSYAATEQTSLTLKGTGLSISDVDAGSGSMSVTLAVTEGTLNVTAGTSGATVSGSGTSSVTLTGTVAQIDNLLSSNATSTVNYIDNTDTPSASSTLTLTVHDNGNTGTGGDLVSVATSTINITAVNDAPVFAATGSTLTLVTNAGASGAVTFTEAALAAYFTDPDSPTIGINTVAAGTGVSNATGTGLGAANVGTVGTVTITDNATLTGTNQFTVTATDGSLASRAATVTFTDNTTGTLTLNAAASGDSIIVNKSTSGATMTGGSGSDYIIGGSGNDTIVGAQNDKLLDGGAGTDTLNIGADFTSTSDAQIVNIENVTLTAAAHARSEQPDRRFHHHRLVRRSTSITAGSGNDTIVGAQNDMLLDGGAGTDTLNIGASFTSTSDAQIVNIENITLTATGTTLNLSNQTEGFNITGSSGADTITGGSGNDTITGGAGADTMTGGAGADRFVINTGDSTVTIGGSNNAGTITGYDVITDFATASDTLDLQGTAAAAANTAGTTGTQSSLQIGSQTIKSHAITNGIITFDDCRPVRCGFEFDVDRECCGRRPISEQERYRNDRDNGSFHGNHKLGGAHLSSTSSCRPATPASSSDYLLVDLSGVTLTSGGTSVTSLISAGRIAPAGVAGEPINLALAAPADHVGAVAVTISGVPAGWSLSEGQPQRRRLLDGAHRQRGRVDDHVSGGLRGRHGVPRNHELDQRRRLERYPLPSSTTSKPTRGQPDLRPRRRR